MIEALGNFSELLAPIWVELSFMIFFALGFLILRLDHFKYHGVARRKKGEYAKSAPLYKTVEVEMGSGNALAALKAWQAVRDHAATPVDILKLVVRALLEAEPNRLVELVVDHFAKHIQILGNAKSTTAVLDVLARAGQTTMMDSLEHEFRHKLCIQANFQTYEVLLGGYASIGDERRVLELCGEVTRKHQKLTARAYSLTIKGYLKNAMVDAALRQMNEMRKQGFSVPAFAVTQLVRTACQEGRGAEIYHATVKNLQFPAEALTHLIEDCHKRSDMELALSIEKASKDNNNPLQFGAYDALLKLCVAQAHAHAIDVFQDMQKAGLRISEGLCVGLLARCADSKFLRFAELLVRFVRDRDGMTISVYSALMKVYAYCGMYDKACDLYAQIRADGLEPDSMMYGCLMKFSVECGRTELSRELFEKAPALDIQNYMSLIKAAGRDRDVDKAFAILEKLKSSIDSVDSAAYNCVLDACVSCGEIKRARLLLSEMKGINNFDVISYNTLLKGLCSKGDVRGASELLIEMEGIGLKPNDVSYNSLINTAVSSGNFKEAWRTIETMERSGVAVDNYTISTMMKASKKAKDPSDVERVLALLDRSQIDVCSDEVLLNTVLETCIRHRQLRRLEGIVKLFAKSNVQPSLHTYGTLIKACSTLKQIAKCWEFWTLMVEKRALQPNDIVLGCMLDALVCNAKVEEAMALFNSWKGKVLPNTVIYSTLIKGFTNSGQASRAMMLWSEMCDLGVAFNTVVFNGLIDSQARAGAMDEVSKLVESMELHKCKPDSITYSTIVKGYCIKGDVVKAFEVFRTMQASGMTFDAVIYNTVMDGCCRHNRMDLVDSVLEDMEKFNVRPSNFTLGILMKMYGRRRQLDKAFRAIEDLPRKFGLQVNSQVRTCLMSACLSNGDVPRALQVFEQIRTMSNGVEVNAYGSLICGLVRLGRVQEAVDFVDEAYGIGSCAGKPRGLSEGHSLENETLEQLLRALSQRHLMDSVGYELLERLRRAHVSSGGRFFSRLQK